MSESLIISDLQRVLLKTDVITQSSWSVSWAAEEESQCPPISYNVKYAVISRDQCENEWNPTMIDYGNTTETHVNLTGLYPYSTYGIYVYPFNTNGWGQTMLLPAVTSETGMCKFGLWFIRNAHGLF